MLDTPIQPYNILIIDDSITSLTILTRLLTEQGYCVRPVISVAQAIGALKQLKPHLILLDVSMPGMTGVEFCIQLKQNAMYNGIPVILISAFHEIKDRIQGYRVGAADYIVKPFVEKELVMKIKSHMCYITQYNELKEKKQLLEQLISEKEKCIVDQRVHVIQALNSIVENNQKEDGPHLRRVSENARRLAKYLQLTKEFELQIDEEFIQSIKVTAPLYNIGKLYDENTIGIKEKHALNGGNALYQLYNKDRNNYYLHMAMEIAKFHHERYDGRGYPQGLKGKEIPLAARIVAVLSAFDKMKEKIREEGKEQEIITVLSEEAGETYDPNILNVLKIVYQELL